MVQIRGETVIARPVGEVFHLLQHREGGEIGAIDQRLHLGDLIAGAHQGELRRAVEQRVRGQQEVTEAQRVTKDLSDGV